MNNMLARLDRMAVVFLSRRCNGKIFLVSWQRFRSDRILTAIVHRYYARDYREV